MFFNAEDDDHDFTAPGKSKLGALFGMDKSENQGGNASLTYTAPKQPKKKETTPPGKGGSPELMFAGVVNAYKYIDNKYTSQGKLGAAILANHSANEYSILMYVTKQQPVSNVKITPAFVYTTQASNYANFYDDARQSWSILHDSAQNATQFAKFVCLVKALSSGNGLNSLVSQDLTLGEGGALDSGDSVEVKYTGWLLSNNTFGQVFDTNTNADKLFRFKLGAGKVIKGWESGVVGMKKGGKRFLVIPPNLAYGSQGMGNKVPPNSTLLFEVEVVRVKLVGRESSTSPAPVQQPPQPSQPPPPSQEEPLEDDQEDHSIKGRTKSITEHMTHSPTGDSSKAKLISRMAKMGKPMLPFSGAVAAEPESDEEPVPESPQPVTSSPAPQEHVHKPVPSRPHRPHAPPPQYQEPITAQYQTANPMIPQQPAQTQPSFLQNLPGAQQVSVYQPQPTLLQQQQTLLQQQQLQQGFPAQSQIFGGGLSTQPAPQTAVPGLPPGQEMMLLSETRQQNTEVRLTLSKVSDKVDQVMQKLEQVNSHNTSTSMMPNMETSVLLHNIQRMVQENERLKKDVFEKSGKIEEQNNKISELLQRNQSYVEKSQTLMEQRNEGFVTSAAQSQSKVLAIEQEKVKLTSELTEATSQISSLQLEVAALRKKEFELQQQLGTTTQDTRKQSDELEQLRNQHKEDEERLNDLSRSLKDEKHGKKMAENNIAQLQEELADLKTTKHSLEKNLSERKKKAAEDKRQLEEELDDVKITLEAEVQSLKERLRKQKTSTNVATAEQISKLEEEITQDWKAKSDKLLAVAAEKHSRALQQVQEEKFELERNMEELEKKITSLRSNASGNDQKVIQLQDEIEELSVWKEKYENLRSSASSMKERYEGKIKEIEEEKETLEEQKDELGELVPRLREEIKKLQSEGATGNVGGAGDAQNLLNEVKKIMNTVYKDLRDKFEAEESYPGSEVLAAILNAIKVTTLSLMKTSQQPAEEKQSESEEDEEEEEEDEEEDESDAEAEEDKTEDQDKIIEKSEPVGENILVTEHITEHSAESEKRSENKVAEPVSEVVNEKVISDSAIKQENEKNNEVVNVENTSTENIISNGVTEQSVVENSGSEAESDVKEQSQSIPDTTKVPNEIDTHKVEPDTEKDNNTHSSPKRAISTDSLDEALDEALNGSANSKDKSTNEKEASHEEGPVMGLVNTEPPPLTENSDDDVGDDDADFFDSEDRKESLFGEDDDDNVAETLGIKPNSESATDTKKTTAKLLANDEDLKPKPPPPLFPDDDDDDDLDWLS